MSLESLTSQPDLSVSGATFGPRSSEKARILVVEDGLSEREALVRVLQFEGYEVPSAREPAAAMQYVDQPIDVVVSDLRMGKQSGIDLLQMWRERRPTTPFIIVTAYGEIESAVNAMKLGARDYITKPIDPTKLLNLIQTCLAERKASQSSHFVPTAGESAADDSADPNAVAAKDESRLDSMEKSFILQTLRKCDGNRTRTAHELGISVRTLQRRLKAWGINAPE